MLEIAKYIFFFLVTIVLTLLSCESSSQSGTTEGTLTDTLPGLPIKEEVFGIARIEPELEIVTLDAATEGKILHVLVKENEEIQKGQEILQLDNALEAAQLAQARSQITRQEASERVAEERLSEIRIQLKKAQQDLNLAQELLSGKAETQKTVDDLAAELSRLEQQKVILQATLVETKAQRQFLEADIRYFQTLLASKKVLAPSDGSILKVLIHAGEYVTSTTEIVEYAPKGAVIAKTEIDELFAEKVEEGQKAAIYSQMTGKELARGTVIFASDYLRQKSLFKNQSTELEDRRVREVKVRLDKGDIPLFGSRVDCKIYLK